jgi:hypothetical protein
MDFPLRKLTVLIPVVGALLLAATPALPQNDSPEAAQAGNRYTISGVVVNSVTDEPIRRALVQLTDESNSSPVMLTDSEGRFQFDGVSGAAVALTARKPGFFNDQELHPDSPALPAIFHVGPSAGSITLKLVPEGTLSGHLLTVKGQPLEDVPVRIFEQRIFDGRKVWTSRGQSTTDEDGQFRVGNLPPGQYLLSAGPSHRGYLARSKGTPREEAVGAMYYPGVPEIEAASPISISAGQQAQADFSLKSEPVFQVSVRLQGLSPGMGAAPQLFTKSGEPVTAPMVFEEQNEKFKTQLPAGSYFLTVRAQDPTGAILEATQPLVVNSDIEGVTLVLGPPMILPIHVEVHHTVTSQAPEANLATQSFLAPGSVIVTEGTSLSTQVPPPPPTQVRLIANETRLELRQFQADQQNSVFAVRNFSPGRYSVELIPNPPWYVQSATSGNIDALREDLVFSSGRRPDPLEIVLRDDGAHLSGTIVSEGQPANGAVLLIPEQGSLNQARLAQTGSAKFRFDDLAPGDYKLLAFDSVEGLEFRNPEVLAPYLSKAVRVTLTANEESSVNVELTQAGK